MAAMVAQSQFTSNSSKYSRSRGNASAATKDLLRCAAFWLKMGAFPKAALWAQASLHSRGYAMHQSPNCRGRHSIS